MDVLVTGTTGFVGSELVRRLIHDPSIDLVYAHIRQKDGQSATERLNKIVEYWHKFGLIEAAKLTKLHIFEQFDATQASLCREVQLVFHCAASTEFDLPIAAARKANVYFTQEVCRFARKLVKLLRFVHFSTVFVAGAIRGRVLPNHAAARFQNTYERSKRESEQAIVGSQLPFTILRLSIVVGDSENGYVYRMRVLYSAWRILLTGHLPRVPIDPRGAIDLIPVDFVVRASRALALHVKSRGAVLHLCSGDQYVKPLEILEVAHGVFGLPMPPLAPQILGRLVCHPWIQFALPHELRQIVEKMRWHLPYLGTRGRIFDNRETEALLLESGLVCPRFQDYGSRLFQFCRKSHWGKMGYVLNKT